MLLPNPYDIVFSDHGPIPEPLLEYVSRNADIAAAFDVGDFAKENPFSPSCLGLITRRREFGDTKQSAEWFTIEGYCVRHIFQHHAILCRDMPYGINPLAAIYLANIPEINSIEVIGCNPEWIKGKFDRPSKAKEVFKGYYAAVNSKESDPAPYIVFSRCGTDLQSILEFTRRWGPLAGEEVFGFDKKIFTPDELSRSTNYFSFTSYSWREIQTRFKRAIAAFAESDNRSPKRPRLAPTEKQLYLEMPYSLSVEAVIASVENGFMPQLRPNSLLSAFWLMLWMDHQSMGVRVCANEKCKGEFRVTRSDRIYCREECGVAVAKRKWWDTTGANNRRKKSLKVKRRRAIIKPK